MSDMLLLDVYSGSGIAATNKGSEAGRSSFLAWKIDAVLPKATGSR